MMGGRPRMHPCLVGHLKTKGSTLQVLVDIGARFIGVRVPCRATFGGGQGRTADDEAQQPDGG